MRAGPPISAVAVLLFVALNGCKTEPNQPAVGQRIIIQANQSGWTLPVHPCARGESHNVPQVDGTTVQTCSVNGVLDGRFVTWHASGVKAQEGSYSNGERTGEWVWWHETGKLATRGNFEHDHEVGEWIWWHPTGQQEARGDHLDGRRAGMWTTWYATGQKRSEGQYQNGTKEGRWLFWDNLGEPEREEVWLNGTLTETNLPKGRR